VAVAVHAGARLIVQNGRVPKSGYEESYFRQRADLGGAGDEIAQKL
jgi:hypothetical protein